MPLPMQSRRNIGRCRTVLRGRSESPPLFYFFHGGGNNMGLKRGVVRAAVVQAAPVIMDRQGTMERIRKLTGEAAEQGAKVILFPEAFIPCYPRGPLLRLGGGEPNHGRTKGLGPVLRKLHRRPRPGDRAVGRAGRRARGLSFHRSHGAGRGNPLLHTALFRT